MCYFDKFSIFFSGDILLAGGRRYHLGEITTEFLNLPGKFLEELQSWTDEFMPAAREMFASKNEKAAPTVQEKLNSIWDLLIELPPYRDIEIDIPLAYHMFPRLVEQKEKWDEVTTQGTDGTQRVDFFLSTMENLSRNLSAFLNEPS